MFKPAVSCLSSTCYCIGKPERPSILLPVPFIRNIPYLSFKRRLAWLAGDESTGPKMMKE